MKRDLGPVWHGIAGITVGALAVLGFTREVLQHDWSLTPWQILEAISWPLGGLVAIGIGLVVIKLLKRRKP